MNDKPGITPSAPLPKYLRPLIAAVSLLCLASAGVIGVDFQRGMTGGGFHLVRHAPIFEADGMRYTLTAFGEGLGIGVLLALSGLMVYLIFRLSAPGKG